MLRLFYRIGSGILPRTGKPPNQNWSCYKGLDLQKMAQSHEGVACHSKPPKIRMASRLCYILTQGLSVLHPSHTRPTPRTTNISSNRQFFSGFALRYIDFTHVQITNPINLDSYVHYVHEFGLFSGSLSLGPCKTPNPSHQTFAHGDKLQTQRQIGILQEFLGDVLAEPWLQTTQLQGNSNIPKMGWVSH